MNYAPISPTDICNIALQKITSAVITDIDDTSSDAANYCRIAFWQTFREVARAHDWNCLKKRTALALLSTAVTGVTVPTTPAYWLASTAYAGGDLVTYGEVIYYCLQAHTSSTNFINDLSSGLWAQQYDTSQSSVPAGNAGSLYEWDYAYALPSDFILMVELNGTDVSRGRGVGSLYEIFVTQTTNDDSTISSIPSLYTNDATASIKYVAMIQDTTIWDSLFTGAFVSLLASKIATPIRSDGGALERALLQEYTQVTLPQAMLRDGGERKFYRYDPVAESNFVQSRYFSTNG